MPSQKHEECLKSGYPSINDSSFFVLFNEYNLLIGSKDTTWITEIMSAPAIGSLRPK